MKNLTNALFGALLIAGAATFATAPAKADVAIGFNFGPSDVDMAFGTPCYGMGYCPYRVYRQPVYLDGYWYQGPIYYREVRGVPYFWYHGNWRRDEWRGPRPYNISWRGWNDHRGWRDGWRGDRRWHRDHDRNWRHSRDRDWDRDRDRDWRH
jgi:hypothetical protein